MCRVYNTYNPGLSAMCHKTNRQVFVLGLLVATFNLINGEITIISPLAPDNSSYPSIIAHPVLYSTVEFDIIAPVVVVNETACNGFDFDATDVIILVTVRTGCSFGRRLLAAKQANAMAVILYSTELTPGRDVRMPPSEDSSGPFFVPGVYISPLDNLLAKLVQNSTQVIIRLTPSPNPWVEFYDSAGCTAYQVVFIVVFAGLLGIGIWKLVETIQSRGCQFAILQAFITIEIINNIIYFVDPFRSRGIYNLPASYILETLHIPLTFIGAMLMTLYWLETVWDYVSSKASAKWLGKMSAPFYVFLGVVISMYFAYLVLAYLGYTVGFTIIIVVWILFGLSAFVLIGVGAKVLSISKRMQSNFGKTSSRNSAVKLMTVKVFVVAAGMLSVLVLYPTMSLVKGWNSLQTALAGNVVVFSSLAIVSCAQLLTIVRKRPSKSWQSTNARNTAQLSAGAAEEAASTA